MVGLPPVTANVTNTVALVFNAIGSVWGSRPELKGQGPWLKRILPVAAVGGAIGAALLLSTPAEGFEKIVPILLGAAPRSRSRFRGEATGRQGRQPPTAHRHGSCSSRPRSSLICIYGGYFGAAAGVLLIALLLHLGHATLADANASKNVIGGVANTVAALVFVFLAPVHWPAVVALGARVPGRVQVGSRGGAPCPGRAAAGADRCRGPGAGRQTRDRRVRLAELKRAVALGDPSPHVDQVLSVRMQCLARVPARLPDQVARPGALDDDAELEARHRDIPVQPRRLAPACGPVGVEQFAAACQSAERGQRRRRR